MSKLNVGSICITDILEQAKRQHSAFVKSPKNGKIYCNVKIWVNDSPDEYGNKVSIQLNSSKEARDTEGKIYIGNAKEIEQQSPQPLSQSDASSISNIGEALEDLPF